VSLTTIGDSARYFALAQQSAQIKSQLNVLSAEMGTGQVQDKVKVLNGDTFLFSAISHSLEVVTAQTTRNTETANRLANMQRALSTLNNQRVMLSETLTKITPETMQMQIALAADQAVQGFSALVNGLNTQVAGRSLFAGHAFDQPALAPANDLLADIVTAIGGATDVASIQTAIDTWFDDPAGGFATVGYLGDAGAAPSERLDARTTITIDARADNAELRNVLKGAATAAVVAQLSGISVQTQTTLLFEGGVMLQSAATDIIAVQSRLGYLEAEVERATAAQATEIEALTIAYNNIALADPFETASALQAVQVQLETHYQITARMSQLSLVNYL